LDESNQKFEKEIYSLAFKTFYNQFIFKYTHAELAYNVVYYVVKHKYD